MQAEERQIYSSSPPWLELKLRKRNGCFRMIVLIHMKPDECDCIQISQINEEIQLDAIYGQLVRPEHQLLRI